MNSRPDAKIASLKRRVSPLYQSRDYAEYCADQKRKGLKRRHWNELPKMWKKELAFRRELEGALNERPNDKGQRRRAADLQMKSQRNPAVRCTVIVRLIMPSQEQLEELQKLLPQVATPDTTLAVINGKLIAAKDLVAELGKMPTPDIASLIEDIKTLDKLNEPNDPS